MTSPIDETYRQVYGHVPSKAGTALERFAAIAMYLIEEGAVTHDATLTGDLSGTHYQLDVHHQRTDNSQQMGEAKDYSVSNSPVGRADIQKLAGALPDLKPITAAAFFSATGYTSPAIKYANAATGITGGKPIQLYELIATTEGDAQGVIKTVVLNLHVCTPIQRESTFNPIFTKSGARLLSEHALRDGQSERAFSIPTELLFDADGHRKCSIYELTSSVGFGEPRSDDACSYACYVLRDHYVQVDGRFFEIVGLEFRVPHTYHKLELRIGDDSANRLVLRDHTGRPLRLLTDKQLREFNFNDEGRLSRTPSKHPHNKA